MKLQASELFLLVFVTSILGSPAPTPAPDPVKRNGQKHTTFLGRTCPTTAVEEPECGSEKCGCLCYIKGEKKYKGRCGVYDASGSLSGVYGCLSKALVTARSDCRAHF